MNNALLVLTRLAGGIELVALNVPRGRPKTPLTWILAKIVITGTIAALLEQQHVPRVPRGSSAPVRAKKERAHHVAMDNTRVPMELTSARTVMKGKKQTRLRQLLVA